MKYNIYIINVKVLSLVCERSSEVDIRGKKRHYAGKKIATENWKCLKNENASEDMCNASEDMCIHACVEKHTKKDYR